MKKRFLEKILVPIMCAGLAVAMLTPAGITAFANDEAVTSESTVTSPEEGGADVSADSVTADVESTDSSVEATTDTESTGESTVAPESQSSQEETTGKSEAAAGETVGEADDNSSSDDFIQIYGSFEYKIKDDGTVRIVNYYGLDNTSITIPDSINGKPVTELGTLGQGYSRGIFEGKSSIQQVIIPDSVTTIGNYTFKGCTSLQQITIPNSVTTIGYDAFRGCHALQQITIPSSVNTIEKYAFSDCTSLQAVSIPDKSSPNLCVNCS